MNNTFFCFIPLKGGVGIIGAIADGILASPNASISACEIRKRTRNTKFLFICKSHCKHVLTYKVIFSHIL